jgi:hypothetical protein
MFITEVDAEQHFAEKLPSVKDALSLVLFL